MLRRCVWELSSSRSTGRGLRAITPQTPFFLSSRNGFATAPAKKPPPQAPAAPPPPPPPPQGASGSGGSLKKLVVAGAVVGAAAFAGYQTGYIDFGHKDESVASNDLEVASTLKDSEHVTLESLEKTSELKSRDKGNTDAEIVGKTGDSHLNELEANHEIVAETELAVEDAVPVKETESSTLNEDTSPLPAEHLDGSKTSSEGSISIDNRASSNIEDKNKPESSVAESSVIDSSIQVPEGEATKEPAVHQEPVVEVPRVSLDEGGEPHKSLADSYLLHAAEVRSADKQKTDALVLAAESGKSREQSRHDEERIILDLIEAIHVAEERQAEKDAQKFAEEKRKLKEKYEKELKDARARELMYAEEAAILEKELNKEKAKAAAAIKSLQEKAEEKLQEELRRKEEEVELQLKEVQELSKAELAAAIVKEKAAQIEKIADANMNINALCMAFYARSEEARQTHSVHKLALGTLALEDALSKGLPIRTEVDTLSKSVEGIDKDSLLNLVLSSLPEEVLNCGTDTYMQLNQKFDSLKGTLRHFSLIPAGGGGLLAHGVAHIASSIKMREDQSGHGIEPVISKVDSYLVQGKFADAAEALEGGVRGTEAEKVVVEWVRQARNRAVVEQALTLLQSYATSITFS